MTENSCSRVAQDKRTTWEDRIRKCSKLPRTKRKRHEQIEFVGVHKCPRQEQDEKIEFASVHSCPRRKQDERSITRGQGASTDKVRQEGQVAGAEEAKNVEEAKRITRELHVSIALCSRH